MTDILEIVISRYFSEMSSDFDEILYLIADWDYNENNVTETKNFKFVYMADGRHVGKYNFGFK